MERGICKGVRICWKNDSKLITTHSLPIFVYVVYLDLVCGSLLIFLSLVESIYSLVEKHVLGSI